MALSIKGGEGHRHKRPSLPVQLCARCRWIRSLDLPPMGDIEDYDGQRRHCGDQSGRPDDRWKRSSLLRTAATPLRQPRWAVSDRISGILRTYRAGHSSLGQPSICHRPWSTSCRSPRGRLLTPKWVDIPLVSACSALMFRRKTGISRRAARRFGYHPQAARPPPKPRSTLQTLFTRRRKLAIRLKRRLRLHQPSIHQGDPHRRLRGQLGAEELGYAPIR